MRYRKNLSTDKLESNTVLYKWSDGSTTISVGDQHYELQTKPLAPPRDSKAYQEVQDSHTYVASPSIQSQLLLMVGHMTNQYTVRPNKSIEDDALEKLQRSLAAAARGGNKNDDKNGPQVITNTQDPELQKKRAELAEKERMRAQRRRETAAEKANIPIGGRRPGGLNVDDLEGRGGRRAPGSGRKPAGAKRPRRRPEYDSDDDLPRGRNREDEYDKEDDFLASSDEELEEGGDDDDEEEILDDESEAEEPKAKKQKQPKPEELSDADADAEADLDDDEAPAPPVASEPSGVRGRKRNIIEDDEDE
jgi:RNA polymerase-associated protein LEO1